MILHNNEINGKVIAITGASGYIGSSLTLELKKYSVKIVRTSRKKLNPIKGVEDWILDLNYLDSWIKIVSEVDIIFHLAGNTSIYNAEQDPKESLMSTLLPITHLIAASKKLYRMPKVVFASTVTVYGLTQKIPVSEFITPNPITTYDLHKLFAEQVLLMASKNNIISTSILRLANVYGPSISETMAADRGVLSKVTRMAFEGKDLKVYGDGNYIRDYVYIDDVVCAFLYASLIKSTEGIFNVATGKGSKVKDVFNLISSEVEKITGARNKVEMIEWPIDVNEIEKRNFIGSIELLKSSSKWKPNVEIEEGVKLLVSHYAKEYFNNELS